MGIICRKPTKLQNKTKTKNTKNTKTKNTKTKNTKTKNTKTKNTKKHFILSILKYLQLIKILIKK
jgi:hypothetical protein